MVSSNPCAGTTPIIKIPFPLLSICTDEFKSAHDIFSMVLSVHDIFSMVLSVYENSEEESDPKP